MPKNLLIVYHSKGGKNAAMAEAVLQGTHHPDIDVDAVSYTHLRAHETLRYLVCPVVV